MTASTSGIGSSIPARARSGMVQYSFVRTTATLLTWFAVLPALAFVVALLLAGADVQAAVAQPPGDLRATLVFSALRGTALTFGFAILTLASLTAAQLLRLAANAGEDLRELVLHARTGEGQGNQ